ncbi:hypothetical protein CVT26_005208 [Gymnopilus dilepis]|uniref:Uncharacterized protein n=1 Tax=Gymnopilus dilepis TaxID=231916 RepID=A0A409YVL6_9AGAR|nr:hypothetical protein CVT26_005208 [Gymnopilus dilepis]
MFPLFGRVFSRETGDVELGKRERESDIQAVEERRTDILPWGSAANGNINFNWAKPAQAPSSARVDDPEISSVYPLLPASFSTLPGLQSDSGLLLNHPGSVQPPPQRAHVRLDRLTVPSAATGNSRSRSNSRSSKQSSRRNAPLPFVDIQSEDRQVNAISFLEGKLCISSNLTMLNTHVSRMQLLEIDELRTSLQAQLKFSEERVKSAEKKSAEAERKAAEAERRFGDAERKSVILAKSASEAEKKAEEAVMRISQVEKALEDEKLWADERLKVAENSVQQEMEYRLREVRKEATICRIDPLPVLPGPNDIDRPCEVIAASPAVGDYVTVQSSSYVSSQDTSRERGDKTQTFLVAPLIDKGKARALEGCQSRIPLPTDFSRPRAGGRRLRLVPPPPRLKSEPSDDEMEALNSETFRGAHSPATLALHQKMEAVLDSHNKMTEMFDTLCAKVSSQSAYRPRRKTDPDFKLPAVRSPRSPQRTAVLKFVRTHLYNLLEISRAQDILKYKGQIYLSITPMKSAMVAFEETGTGSGPALKPAMHINWDKLDGKWNAGLCSQFIDYLVYEQGYADGEPTDEEQQIAVNIFWEQLDRLREIIKQNRPKDKETEEQTSARMIARQKEERAKASMNSRRKNTFHDRIDTCLLHLQSQGLPDDERKAWKSHFTTIEELGIEGMSSDDPDEEDPLTFDIRTLPWRAKELTKICAQTDAARNTTNAYGNRRAGNLPRIRRRKEDGRASSRKAPAGKPLNFYDPDWYQLLGRARQIKLAPKESMVFLNAELDD